jgi:hypothetical protein
MDPKVLARAVRGLASTGKKPVPSLTPQAKARAAGMMGQIGNVPDAALGTLGIMAEAGFEPAFPIANALAQQPVSNILDAMDIAGYVTAPAQSVIMNELFNPKNANPLEQEYLDYTEEPVSMGEPSKAYPQGRPVPRGELFASLEDEYDKIVKNLTKSNKYPQGQILPRDSIRRKQILNSYFRGGGLGQLLIPRQTGYISPSDQIESLVNKGSLPGQEMEIFTKQFPYMKSDGSMGTAPSGIPVYGLNAVLQRKMTEEAGKEKLPWYFK